MSLLHAIVILLIATPIIARPGRKVQSNNPQNFQLLLTSIDEKLGKLDNLIISQNDEVYPGLKKLQMIDEKLERIESTINVQGVKINENFSQSHYKYDIDKDHFLRNVDLIYDRVNHKLAYLEMKIDMGEKKIFEKLEAMNTKFDKMLDNLTTREGDIESEIVDILVAIDELKSNTESQNISKALNKTLSRFENYLSSDVKSFQEILVTHENSLKELDKNLYLRDTRLDNVGKAINETKNDLRNGLRSLTVEVGRLGGKKSQTLDDEQSSSSDFEQLSKKLDENFENIMLLQKLFLESCHRVQMDEVQLETKISEVLEQLIDSFEKKSSMENKDLKTLEHLLKTHDVTVRRSLHTTSQNLISISHNNKLYKDDISLQMLDIKEQMQLLTNEVGSFKSTAVNPKDEFVSKLKDLENYINNTQVHISKNEIKMSALLNEIGNRLHEIKVNVSNSIEESSKQMRNFDLYLKSIMKNLNVVTHFFQLKSSNNTIITEIEDMLLKFLTKIDLVADENVENTTSKEITTEKTIYQDNATEDNLEELIVDIFGKPPNNTVPQKAVVDLDIPIDIRAPFPESTLINCTSNKCDD